MPRLLLTSAGLVLATIAVIGSLYSIRKRRGTEAGMRLSVASLQLAFIGMVLSVLGMIG